MARGDLVAPELILLGDAIGGDTFSDGQAVTPDGNTVVGVTRDSLGVVAFRWTRSTGLLTLGRLNDSTPDSQAVCVSADGLTAGGFSATLRGPGEPVLFSIPTGTITNLRGLRGSFAFGIVTGLSSSGVFASGTSLVGNNFNLRGWRYSPDEGIVTLPLPVGFTDAQSTGISPEGSCVVGVVGSNFFQTAEPFIWRRSTGTVPLGRLPGGAFSSAEARGCSAYGKTVIGHSYSARGNPEAFRYTARLGMVGLGDLPGGNFESYARGVSADGTVIVGIASTGSVDTPPAGYEAFYWTAAQGMRPLRDVAIAAGINLQGFVFERAQAVSADGSVVVGQGRQSGSSIVQAFLVRLPKPPRSPDWNNDGNINIDDIFIFLNDWFLGNGDFNSNGITNIDDIFIFLNAWFGNNP